jgi:WD40 repeat protein
VKAEVGCYSDVYGLGAILFYLVTGRPPFVAENFAQTLHHVLNTESVSPRLLNPSVPQDIATICLKCLEKESAKRYSSAHELARELGRFLCDEPIYARPVSHPQKLWRWCRRKPALASAAGVALLLFLVIAVGSPTMTLRISRQRERAEEQTRRAQTAVTRLEIERAESMFAADNSSRALAHLARLLRQQPTNAVVAERLMSALSYRNFCLPAAPPLQHRSPLLPFSNSTPGLSDFSRFVRLGSIRAANFSPDAQRVVTASRDGTAQVWDSRTGQSVGEPLKHEAPVMWAQFSADGKRVVTASLDKTARVWDSETGHATTPPLRHDDGVLFSEFSSDGRKVATASLDKTVRLWDVRSGQPLLEPLLHSAAMYFAQFSSNGTSLLVASASGTASILNSDTGGKVASFPHRFPAESVTPFPQFDSDGRKIVTLNAQDAAIWGVPQRKVITAPMKHENSMHSVRLSSDGKFVATASKDNTARVWDATTGEPVTPPIKHENWVESAQFDVPCQRLVTASRDNTARIWDARTGKPLTEPLRQESPVRFAQFSPDGHRLVTFSELDAAWLWNIRLTRPFSVPLRHKKDVRCAVFSPDGSKIATVSWDGTARVWDARTGRAVTGRLNGTWTEDIQFSPDGERLVAGSILWDVATGERIAELIRHADTIWTTRFSPDGTRMATASKDGTARVWDGNTGQLLALLRHADSVNCAQFSPDGPQVATASFDGTARIWDSQTGHAITNLQHDDRVHWVEFSPDGKKLATASKDKTVRLWDARTGKMLMKPLSHADELYLFRSVVFSPDGTRVAAAAGSIAQLWDAHTGEPFTAPLKHDGRVNSVRFSPDGRRLVTTSYDNTGRIWDVATGHPLSEPLRHSGRVQYAEFSPDGRSVVTASSDGTARIWEVAFAPLPIPDWLPELAEAVAGQKIDPRDISENVPVRELFQLKERLNQSSSDDVYSIWAKWFFADDTSRSVLSPLQRRR